MTGTIKITDKNFQKKVNDSLIKKIKRFSVKNIENFIKNSFREVVTNSLTWQSLLGGPNSLAADFGIRRGENAGRLNEILNVWTDSIEVKTKIINRPRTFQFVMEIYGIRADYSDVIELDAAITENINKKGERERLKWLEWLLLKGDTEVVSGYRVVYGLFQNSRSGYAVMKEDGSFSVNPAFSGRAGNNFITDTIQKIYNDNKFSDLIKKEIIKSLN